jgi:predicted nucleic acid-binding protein
VIPTAVLDATLLSNFAHGRRPDLLHLALGEGAATTPAVMAELQAGEALGLVPLCDWDWLTVVEPSNEEQRLALSLKRQLDPGEAECLAVAQTRRCKFFSDDFAARRLARHHKLTVSGTLGVLLALVDEKRLSQEEADSLLAIMMSHGYRSPVNSLRLL